jgi:hypothetical protein
LLGNTPKFEWGDKFLEFTLSEPITRIVCSYLGMFCKVVDIDLWGNVPTPVAKIYSQRWHRDPEDRRLVKVFLYLRDVDARTGPFCYIPGSHNGGPYGRVFPQKVPDSVYPADGEVEQRFSENQMLTCTGKAGTLIFCDTSGLHRGGHATDRLRLLLTSAYTTHAGLDAQRYVVSGLKGEHLSLARQYALGKHTLEN